MSVTLDDERSMRIRWGRVASTTTAGKQADQVRVEFAPNSGNFLSFTVEDDKVAAIHFEQTIFRRVRQIAEAR